MVGPVDATQSAANRRPTQKERGGQRPREGRARDAHPRRENLNGSTGVRPMDERQDRPDKIRTRDGHRENTEDTGISRLRRFIRPSRFSYSVYVGRSPVLLRRMKRRRKTTVYLLERSAAHSHSPLRAIGVCLVCPSDLSPRLLGVGRPTRLLPAEPEPTDHPAAAAGDSLRTDPLPLPLPLSPPLSSSRCRSSTRRRLVPWLARTVAPASA